MSPPTRIETARAVAHDALVRIESDGAYANLALGAMLQRSDLDGRDRAFATELVYGTTRLRRRLDHLADRFLSSDPPLVARVSLRLGAYQLTELGTPPHAAIGETVEVTPKRYRGLVNAVLRRVATEGADGPWPNLGTELSYPDWIVERLVADLGADDAVAALRAMNETPSVTTRDDGYTQDLASQWVAGLVGAAAGDRAIDVCAAPGGKATAMAAGGAWVVAADSSAGRVGLITSNIETLGSRVVPVVADAASPPWRPGSFDRVLVDAPCSGLGVLHRRPDARWRITPDAMDRLATIQQGILDASVPLVAPGGTLTYSVCTLTHAETVDIAAGIELPTVDRPAPPWRPAGTGALLLPQDAGTDGMFCATWRA